MLKRRGAEFIQCTNMALRVARAADLAAVKDQQVRNKSPIFLGDEFHEVLFDFDGIGMGGQAQASREAADVGVDHDADVFVEGVAQDDVGGFAAYAAQAGQFLHGLGHIAAEFFQNVLGGLFDGFGFAAEKTGGLDDFFDVSLRSGGQGLDGGIFFEEDRGDHVDAHIGALGGEDGGDEQLERVLMVQGAVGRGVEAF